MLQPAKYLVFAILASTLGNINAWGSEEETDEDEAFGIKCGISHIPIIEENTATESEAHLIIGGVEARQGSWPFVAWLQYKKRQMLCGAAVLNEEWLITAAHCVHNVINESENVRAILNTNELYLFWKNDKEAIVRKTDYFVEYPGYNPRSMEYDLALVHLDKPLEFSHSSKTVPVCLPNSYEELSPGTNVYILGWGKTSEELYAMKLRQVKIPVISYDRCVQLQKENEDTPPDEKAFCVMNEKGGHSACFGDSGGPVLAFDGESWVIYGVISKGPDTCGLPGQPSINTKVAAYIDWINSVMRNKHQK